MDVIVAAVPPGRCDEPVRTLTSFTSGNHRIAAALRLAAYGLQNAKCQMGQYCRRMKGRLGKAEDGHGPQAGADHLLHDPERSAYDEKEAFKSNPGIERKREKALKSLAKKMGFDLVPIQQQASS